MQPTITRREVITLATGSLLASTIPTTAQERAPDPRPYLTPAKDFNDVSRGSPVPHTLQGQALIDARLTPETWRLEMLAEDKATVAEPHKLEDNTALDYAGLLRLAKNQTVRFLKAMQCNNIARPLGQGLWEGIPLRTVLEQCGKIDNARRLYYWGFHNNDPKQVFRSSLAMSQVLDTPPGELPVFLAFKLNGEPIPLVRGGPVRMVVPWAHGFKSVKWLQRIVLTNRYDPNDTYAEQNNDPESYLKTAAYFDSINDQALSVGKQVVIRGTAMVGWPGLERIEYWLRPVTTESKKVTHDDPEWAAAPWRPALLDPAPTDWGIALPEKIQPRDVWGFNTDDQPKDWPMRYSLAQWSLPITIKQPGRYELRVRSVDKNGFAQPHPRSGQKSGRNLVQMKVLTVE
ncbi:MAG: molybdopterin-dependent oxidoreductase [Gemmatales bacterium]